MNSRVGRGTRPTATWNGLVGLALLGTTLRNYGSVANSFSGPMIES
jgi:hypothetical protein